MSAIVAWEKYDIDGLVQDCSNSSVIAVTAVLC